MKQAILITAYKDLEHLRKIVDYFDSDFSIYIHIDKKSLIKTSELKELASLENVKFAGKKFIVNWGGFNHLRAIIFLSKLALEDNENFFFHLISGSDFPIKEKKDFKSFFFENKEKIFLNHFEVPYEGWAGNGGMDRLQYYHFYDLWNYKIQKEKYRIKKLINIQKKFNLKRSFPKRIPRIYGGSTWWSMSRDALEYVVRVKRKKSILSRFRYTFCSEEFYFQTVVLNSKFSHRVDNNSLRYIDWNYRNGNNPAILDDSDFDKLLRSDAFFARKMVNPVSAGLVLNLRQIL